MCQLESKLTFARNLYTHRGMGSDGTVGANKEAVKIIAAQEGMHAQVTLG